MRNYKHKNSALGVMNVLFIFVWWMTLLSKYYAQLEELM